MRLRWDAVAELPGERQVSDFHCVTGLVGRGRALGGHPARDDHRPRAPDRCGEVRHAAVDGGAVRRPGLARAVPRARRDARAPHGRQAADALARLAAAARAPAHVRLQGRQVGARAALRRRRRRPATGSSAATTPTPGSASRTAMAKAKTSASCASRARERAAHWLLAATFFVMLFTGLCLSVSSFEGILDRPTAKAWHLWSAIALGRRARADRPARRPPRAGAQRARARPLRRRRRALAARRAAPPAQRPAGSAAGALQRRPEAQRRPHRRPDAGHVRHRRPALVRRARHDLPLRGQRDRARLGHADPDAPGRRPPLPRACCTRPPATPCAA